MANEEHLAILMQGVEIWNRWRNEHLDTMPDLSGADLCSIDLSRADLSETDLNGANLNQTTLCLVNFWISDLRNVNLSYADLRMAQFIETNLTMANLSHADLTSTNFNMAVLDNTDFSRAICQFTNFGYMDLSLVKNLEVVEHLAPSIIDVNTLYRSKGKIPEIFLRGCGVPETLITFLPSLLEQTIQFYSCFISYSHADAEFARRLHDRLEGEGIRCWLDEHQLNPGDPLHPTIYEAIRVYDKVLLCCSEASLKSWWVEKEFNRVIRKEEDYRDTVLIPLNLDSYLFTSECEGWIADEVKQRLAADFTGWKDHDGFEKAFKGVVKALRTDGGKPPPPEPKLKPKQS